MFCPSCGAKNSTEQKFCRACGLNLEETALSLVRQFPQIRGAELGAAERRLKTLGNIAFGGLGLVGLVAVIGMIYTIFVKFILDGSSVVSGIVFILLLVFAVLGLTYVILNESLKEKQRPARDASIEPELEAGNKATLLEEKYFEPAASVIEDTTALLEVKRTTKPLE